MNRRNFTHATVTSAAALGTLATVTTVGAQTPDASPAASPTATSWQSEDYPVTITFDTEIFGKATTSGVTGEWCVLRIEDIERFLSFIIKLEDKYPTEPDAIRDIVENDPELEYPDTEITRLEMVENNNAYGVLYRPALDHAPDTWSYSEYIPSEDGSRPTIQLWIASRVSKLDRELMETAVASVQINGEPAVRAIDVAELFDKVEAIEIEEAE